MDPSLVETILSILRAGGSTAIAVLAILLYLDARKERRESTAKQLADKDATIGKYEALIVRVVTAIEGSTAEDRRLVETIREHDRGRERD